MDNFETLSYAGQVILDDATIISSNGVGFNVMGQIAGFSVYEDIWSPFLKGDITLFETVDLLNLFPLVGEEQIILSFHTPECKKHFYRKMQFYIYQMSDFESNDRSNIYKLHLMSVEAVIDINTKLSKTYSGSVSDIAKKLLTDVDALNTTKKYNIEKSPAITKFIANYWSPMTCLNYVAETSYNDKGSPSYIFFENAMGLNFVSLESLYGSGTMWAFSQNNYTRNIDPKSGKALRDPKLEMQNIIELSVPEGFDYIERCEGGMYGSTMITVDPITKKYTSRNFKGKTTFNKFSHLNKFSLISDKAIARSAQVMIYMPKHYGNFNGFPDVTNASVVQQRTSFLKQSTAFKIRIDVYGNTSYTVGQKVNIHVNSKQPTSPDDTDTTDRILSGNYIISAIRHDVTREQHLCSIELMKDSLIRDLNKVGVGKNE